MLNIDIFSQYLKSNTQLSESSIYKYSRAVKRISIEMKNSGIISKDILNMNLSELDIAICLILHLPSFIEKDTKGNKMYSNALKHYRQFLYSYDNDINNATIMNEEIIQNNNLDITQRTAIINSRVGQGVFRHRIMKKYNGKCVITGINIEKCLIASHIKPWAVCNNEERLSENNGLLLSATYDKLFDSGLISFKENGHIIISNNINQYNRQLLNLSDDIQINLNDSIELKNNMEYHRDILFIR